jgi:hypothetical protein
MQISGRTWCGKHGIPFKEGECKKVLLENTKVNIEVGTQILRGYYSEEENNYECESFKSDNQDEPAVDRMYSGWERALRSYNGWGCAKILSNGKEIFANHDYVEKIMDTYTRLQSYVGE